MPAPRKAGCPLLAWAKQGAVGREYFERIPRGLWPGLTFKEHIVEARYRIGPVNVMDPRLRRLLIDKNP